MNLLTPSLILVIGGLFVAFFLRHDEDELISQNLVLPFSSPLDKEVFEKVVKVFEKFKASEEKRPVYDFDFQSDISKGIVTSNWFRTHKGEVIIKIEVGISGTFVRVEGWQKVGFLSSIQKTVQARRMEREFQEAISKALKGEEYQF